MQARRKLTQRKELCAFNARDLEFVGFTYVDQAHAFALLQALRELGRVYLPFTGEQTFLPVMTWHAAEGFIVDQLGNLWVFGADAAVRVFLEPQLIEAHFQCIEKE